MPGERVAYSSSGFPSLPDFYPGRGQHMVRLGLDVRVYSLYGPRPAPAWPDGRSTACAIWACRTGRYSVTCCPSRTWGPSPSPFLRQGGAPVAQPGDRGEACGPVLPGAPGRDHDGRGIGHSTPLGRRPGHRGLVLPV